MVLNRTRGKGKNSRYGFYDSVTDENFAAETGGVGDVAEDFEDFFLKEDVLVEIHSFDTVVPICLFYL